MELKIKRVYFFGVISPFAETAMFVCASLHPDKILTVLRHLAESLARRGGAIGQRKGEWEEVGDKFVLQLHCGDT